MLCLYIIHLISMVRPSGDLRFIGISFMFVPFIQIIPLSHLHLLWQYLWNNNRSVKLHRCEWEIVSQRGRDTVGGVELQPAVALVGTEAFGSPGNVYSWKLCKMFAPVLDLNHNHYLASELANSNCLIKHSTVLPLWLWGHSHSGLQ